MKGQMEEHTGTLAYEKNTPAYHPVKPGKVRRGGTSWRIPGWENPAWAEQGLRGEREGLQGNSTFLKVPGPLPYSC